MLPTSNENELTSGLDKITSPLTKQQASHLLNRCLFGAKLSEVESFVGKTIDEALSILLMEQETPVPPVVVKSDDLPIGETWVDAAYNSKYNFNRKYSYRNWWIDQMVHQLPSLQEKMVLFHHNHFATETVVVKRPRFMYKHNVLLREFALGNFQTLTECITVDPSMLIYLDGTQNKVGAANENYGRELLELFTIGKGPQIEPGNYTHYTEQDVLAAARVLTGWQINKDNVTSIYNSSRHDKTNKQFSEAFNKKVIGNEEGEEYRALIQMIFAQEQTSKYIVTQLYRFFVNSNIDDAIEQSVIDPLAKIFRDKDFELKPVLRALFSSQHFFSTAVRGVIIKSPIEFIVGTCRKLELVFPEHTDPVKRYYFLNILYTQCSNQEMKPGDPPGVAGWTAYYQEPAFYRIWITAVSLPIRSYFTNKVTDTAFWKDGYKFICDGVSLVAACKSPEKAYELIQELAGHLFPMPLTEQQYQVLLTFFLDGTSAEYWKTNWENYLANPSDATLKQSLDKKIRSLLKTMLRFGEYHLS